MVYNLQRQRKTGAIIITGKEAATLKITTLMDNLPSENKALVNEHGLSVLIERGSKRFLFDCGQGAHTWANARRLGLNVKRIDAVILSHSHYDHAAGFRDLIESGEGGSMLWTGPRFFEPKYAFDGLKYTDLSCGFGQCLALTENGEVYAWGRNHAGQVGTGNTKTPIREVHQVDLPRIVDIGCCGNHSAAVDEDGNLWMWGSNEYHQISPAKDKKITSPVKIDLGFRVREVELGGHHTAVVDEEGNLYMWGRNSSCQVGVPKGKSDWVAEPVKLDLPLPVKMIDCYGALTWVVLEDGSLWTWGLNTYGQMGVGFYTGGESGLPLSHGEREYQGKTYSSKVLDGGIRDITIGDMFGAVLTEDGTVLTCGINKFGQLGRDARYRGPENFTLTPIPIRLAGE